ncbi:MAG: metallophosphoesterase, partial [Bacteroidetes bacterium]|nr:metallophosphoesterase [Bacteroidota bacterium]
MSRYSTKSILLLLSLLLSACMSTSVYVAPSASGELQPDVPTPDRLSYEVYLIGDAGGSNGPESEPALRLLKTLTSEAGSDGLVVFLGDNAYCCGLPDSGDTGRARAEMRVMEQINAVRDYRGRVVFIPGNHDWGSRDVAGPDVLARQESFIEEQFDGENVFLPDNGLPGPVEVKLKDGLSLVVLDTEWWMTDADKPFGDSGEADIEEEGDLILGLQDLLSRRRKDDLIVVGHHPIRSNGRHGGHFSIKDHLFPLTAVFDNAWLPLPIVGSLYPLLRRAVGGPQDFSNWKYASFRRALDAIFRRHEGRLVYASGHEHSLQYFAEDNVFHVISGAGSRPDSVDAGHGAEFTHGGEGFI